MKKRRAKFALRFLLLFRLSEIDMTIVVGILFFLILVVLAVSAALLLAETLVFGDLYRTLGVFVLAAAAALGNHFFKVFDSDAVFLHGALELFTVHDLVLDKIFCDKVQLVDVLTEQALCLVVCLGDDLFDLLVYLRRYSL